MARKTQSDKDLERGKRFAFLCENLFQKTSREKIGEKLGGYSESTVRKWVGGLGLPNKALMKLSEIGVSTDWFLTGCGEMLRGSRKSPPAEASGVQDVNPELLDAVYITMDALLRFGRHLAGGQREDDYPKLVATRDALQELLEHIVSSPQSPDAQDHIA